MANASNSSLPVTQMQTAPSSSSLDGPFAFVYVFSTTGILGILTNGFAITVIYGFTNIWQKTKFYLLINQILLDFVACMVIAIQHLSVVKSGDPIQSVFNVIIRDSNLCRWWYAKFFMWSLINSSNCNIVMVTFERYLKILHPWTYDTLATKVKAKMVVVAVWLFGVITQLLPGLLTTTTNANRCVRFFLLGAAEQTLYGVVTLILQFFLPILMLAFAYLRLFFFIARKRKAISVTSSQSASTSSSTATTTATTATGDTNNSIDAKVKKLSANQGHSSAGDDNLSKIQYNILKTAIAVSACFFFCWSWLAGQYVLSNLKVIPTNFYWSQFGTTMLYLQLCINPILYTISLQPFNNGVKKLIKKLRKNY